MSTDEGRKFAVITGASSGIGFEFARVCAAEAFDVLVVAEQGVEEAAERLRAEGAAVTTLQADLATYDGNEGVTAAIKQRGRPVDILALNAGRVVGGPFLETDLESDLALIQLNVGSVVHLSKRLLPAMVARGEGRVLITSSVAAAMPGPYYATYAASKSYLLSFAEAIRYELKETGITVTALMPGPTDTEIFDRGGMQNTRLAQGPKDDPAEVARDAFEALMDGDHKVVAGSVKNRLQTAVARVSPEGFKAAQHAAQTKPKDLEEE
ncbi:MAG TPA: SDR family NAD(P)-dependent oxidoreductase [Propionibacteriaceae bacterium]|nr:SDR family NAD(P)-dependent oxidoreductase [Propionibacteriaceae bacterium]